MPTEVINPALGVGDGIQVDTIVVDQKPLNSSSSELEMVVVENQRGAHESVTITARLAKAEATSIIDKTITFNYGPSTRRGFFCGYVVKCEPSRNYQKDTVYDITCYGVTWPMQSGHPRWWNTTSATDAAYSIVKDYPLAFRADKSSYQWPSLAQTGQSDWEYLNHLADRVGYSVYTANGTVSFVNPLNILNTTAPVVSLIKGDNIFDKSRELLDFQPMSKSLRLRSNIRPAFGFFGGTQANAEATLSDPLEDPYRLVSDTAVADKDMADMYQRAWDRMSDFWTQFATARVNGNASLVPGVLLMITVSPTVSRPNEFDGLWLLDGVKHVLTHNSFQTELTMMRDDKPRTANLAIIAPPRVKRGTVQLKTVPGGDRRWEVPYVEPVLFNEFHQD